MCLSDSLYLSNALGLGLALALALALALSLSLSLSIQYGTKAPVYPILGATSDFNFGRQILGQRIQLRLQWLVHKFGTINE